MLTRLMPCGQTRFCVPQPWCRAARLTARPRESQGTGAYHNIIDDDLKMTFLRIKGGTEWTWPREKNDFPRQDIDLERVY